MEIEPSKDKQTIITEIKHKIRLLNAVAGFIVVTLLAVILRYLYKPFTEAVDFLPDISIKLIISIVIGLTLIGFYVWGLVSRQIISSIERYRNRLDRILNFTRDLREEIYGDILLDKIMDHSLSITQSDAGSILIIEKNNLFFKIVKGEKSVELLGTSIPKGKGIAGWVAQHGQALLIADAQADERFNPHVDAITGFQTRSVLCVPLMMKTNIIGVVELLNKKEGFYGQKDEELISYLADQAAISISRARFFEDQKNYEIHLTDMLLEAIDFHIPEKAGHSKRVARYSSIIAKATNLAEERQKKLYFASLLHDIGFLKIRSEDYYNEDIYKKHPVVGYEMIRPITFYADIAPLILYHHERYDGTGYPKGLKETQIPLETRIISIAEAFDVMVSTTSYKVPMDFDTAIEELKKNAGTQFDPKIVQVFIDHVKPEHLQ
jgi:putative methionine-R-sulfoxide reductase with GAF domain